jgi:hypothetical protein
MVARTVSSDLRILALSVVWLVVSVVPTAAEDLSRYRGFQLGMSLSAVARQAGIGLEPRVLQHRPALIQELMWQPARVVGVSAQPDSVRKVLFTFYNGQLFRMVISYDRQRTEGLTPDDVVAALSVTYGPPILEATPLAPLLSRDAEGRDAMGLWQESLYSHYLEFDDEVVARWGDSENSVHLFRSSYQFTFALVLFSKSLDRLARTATLESVRLDAQEAPQRELDRQQQLSDDTRVKRETARRLNKDTFRP